MRTLFKITLLNALLIVALTPIIAFADIKTEIYPLDGSVDDLFSLSFSINGHNQNTLPDFSPLEKNFEIESTNSSTQISVINGQMSSEMKWVVSIRPREAGTLSIPPINFGQDKSKPLTLKVKQSSSPSDSSSSPKTAFLKNDVSVSNPFVQSEVLYTVKLYFSKRLSGADFLDPHAENSLLMQLGEATSHQETVNGKRYYVLEQQYALFPEKSGTLKIAPPVFKGIIERDGLSRIDHLLMDVQKPITLKGQPITLTVKPKPESYTAPDWLPAKQLELSEKPFDHKREFEVGKPITREITLSALGLTASQLPNLNFPENNQFNVYPEKALTQNKVKDNSILASKTFKVIYLPLKAGTLTLPPIELSWWNIKSGKQEVAHLNEISLNVLAGTKNKSTPPPTKPNSVDTPSKTRVEKQSNNTLPWVIVALLSASWVLFFVLKATPFKALKKTSNQKTKASRPKNFKKAFKQACQTNNAKNAASYLLKLANQTHPQQNFENLSEIATFHQDEDFSHEINQLLNHLYGKEKRLWNGKTLWQAFEKLKKKKKSHKTKETELPPFNPS